MFRDSITDTADKNPLRSALSVLIRTICGRASWFILSRPRRAKPQQISREDAKAAKAESWFFLRVFAPSRELA